MKRAQESSFENRNRKSRTEATKVPKRNIPISLGKPSLRQRLEAYYSLVNPSNIKNEQEWLLKFNEIYEKFGGSIEGEKKLAAKLQKKYGDIVCLLTVPLENNAKISLSSISPKFRQKDDKDNNLYPESFYLFDETTSTTHKNVNVKISSINFNPLMALKMNETDFLRENNLNTLHTPLLDNISKVRYILPECDPQRLVISKGNNPHRNHQTQKQPSLTKREKKSVLTSVALQYSQEANNNYNGPFSLLYDCFRNKIPVKILIRYVDCIRGYIIANQIISFDKHCNLILRDCIEYYYPRLTTTTKLGDRYHRSNNNNFTNLEVEIYRRSLPTTTTPTTTNTFTSNKGSKTYNDDPFITMDHAINDTEETIQRKTRKFGQMMIRGDNVVMICKAPVT